MQRPVSDERPQLNTRKASVPSNSQNSPADAKVKKLTAGKIILRVLLVFFTVIIFLFGTFMVSLKFMSSDRFPTAQRTLITTLLETGQMKFRASWLLPPDKIQSIVDSNSMKEFNEEVDDSLIKIGGQGSFSVDGKPAESDEEDIQVIEISGAAFYANMIIVKDPSRVSVATIYPWRSEGVTLDRIVKDSGSLGGINGGLYNSYNNSGGAPYGVCVSNGEIQLNDPYSWPGLVLIGLTEDNILQIINIDGMTAQQVEDLIKTKKIRDAVTFQEESSDTNNHFVQLVINGEARELSGMGSGLNPRTAIGQRADGALLLLVTDGRGKNGHLGASASDLINVMLEYGAVNAANLDGGSSSCMYYKDEWLMTSVTFYYSNASWKLPLAFVFK
ncbi:MAG: phosphodiester glycosidase family protein [Clostridia bacterium]|nr:phosphodiester glycosidase family protein [Clostridia bacterium]